MGIFPQGSSPYGILDMSGNVWEWCLNEYSNPEKIDVRSKNDRVVRGGSWRNYQPYVRAANRFSPDIDSDNRDDSFGFRLVVCPPEGQG